MKQKRTTIDLIIYKHSTLTNLRHLTRVALCGSSQTPGVTKEILDLFPFLIPPNQHQKQKDES